MFFQCDVMPCMTKESTHSKFVVLGIYYFFQQQSIYPLLHFADPKMLTDEGKQLPLMMTLSNDTDITDVVIVCLKYS